MSPTHIPTTLEPGAREQAALDAYRLLMSQAAQPADPMQDAGICTVAAARLLGQKQLRQPERWRFQRKRPRLELDTQLTDEQLFRLRRRRGRG